LIVSRLRRRAPRRFFILHETNVPQKIEAQKNDRAPAQPRGSWDGCREEEIRPGEDARWGRWNDGDGPRSWLAVADSAASSAVFRIAPRRLFRGLKFWRSVEFFRLPLRRALLGAIFGTDSPKRSMTRKIGHVSISASCEFGEAHWSIRYPDGHLVEGDEYLTFISRAYGISQGVAHVRTAEAYTNCRFDAQCAAELQAAISGWYARGAPPNKGRHS
jgi:hypothetical protein